MADYRIVVTEVLGGEEPWRAEITLRGLVVGRIGSSESAADALAKAKDHCTYYLAHTIHATIISDTTWSAGG